MYIIIVIFLLIIFRLCATFICGHQARRKGNDGAIGVQSTEDCWCGRHFATRLPCLLEKRTSISAVLIDFSVRFMQGPLCYFVFWRQNASEKDNKYWQLDSKWPQFSGLTVFWLIYRNIQSPNLFQIVTGREALCLFHPITESSKNLHSFAYLWKTT